MTNKFSCVIDDVILVPVVRRGNKFTHPITKQKILLGGNTEDSYFEKYDLYPRADVLAPSYDPKRQIRIKLQDLWDAQAKTVTPQWSVTDKTVSKVAEEKLGEVSKRLDSELIPLRGGVSDIQRETWARFAEGALNQGRNPGSASTILQARADKQGKTIAQIKDKVLLKSEPIDQQLGDLFGQSDILNDAVDAAVSHPTMTDELKIDTILAIAWPV